MPAPDACSIDQLSRLIGTPRAPLVLDVRDAADTAADPRRIPAAEGILDGDPVAWAQTRSCQPIVVSCQRGAKRAMARAAQLRAAGFAAEVLEGGFEGWRAAGHLLVNPAALPAPDARGRTQWVTRHRPKVDRVACAWLIRRFIDVRAVLLFVAPSEVLAVAELTGAAPFDIEGVRFSHRGERCSFDAMLDDFGLQSPVLETLATIVRGADTARFDLAAQSAGLLAVSLGLSRLHADDLAQIDAAMTVYDALFRWVRDAQDEGHSWPNPGPNQGKRP